MTTPEQRSRPVTSRLVRVANMSDRPGTPLGAAPESLNAALALLGTLGVRLTPIRQSLYAARALNKTEISQSNIGHRITKTAILLCDKDMSGQIPNHPIIRQNTSAVQFRAALKFGAASHPGSVRIGETSQSIGGSPHAKAAAIQTCV